jgi:hypothetical protein
MSNRPQTLYGIADSRVGLAAWIGWSTPCNAHLGRLARESAWPRGDGAAFINVVILGAVPFYESVELDELHCPLIVHARRLRPDSERRECFAARRAQFPPREYYI